MVRSDNRAVVIWLLICCALIYAMIVLGGVTRLTGSGLSMVDWDPIMGTIPPLSERDWQSVFAQYKQFPEYQKVNRGMSLAEFKGIFYFEYAHRVLGRLIGLAFLAPLLVFIALGHIKRAMIPRFVIMFILGGLQGLMGWFMVKSGLVDRPSVSQYRLTAHLLLALFIYGFILWSALCMWRGTARRASNQLGYRFGWLVVALLLVMIASGGFVAGTRAGFVYNTFPLMAGAWVPEGLWSLAPWWRNLFENVVTIQFTHRVLAVLVAVVVVAYCWGAVRGSSRDPGVRTTAWLTLAALGLQITLGITTLVYQVPVILGASHQAGAVALFTVLMLHLHWRKFESNPVPR